MIGEINADITTYNMEYKRQLFVIYDLGVIRDKIEFERDIESSGDDTKYQWELSVYLNRDICQPEGYDAYGYPPELFRLDMERIGILPRRKPAKVIDLQAYKEST